LTPFTGSAESNLFDLVKDAKSGNDAWADLDALTYVIQSGQTGENALVGWSALLDGASALQGNNQ